jgi:hypothetical protein
LTIVELSEAEVRVCTLIASERWLAKRWSVDRPNYATGKSKGYLEHELLSNIRANVCEYAVSKLYVLPWTFPWYPNSEHPRRKDHPDVGQKVEVRSIRTRDAVPVWSKDVDKQAIIVAAKVLEDDYFSQVEVYGHIPVSICQRDDWFSSSEGCWRVPLDAFYPFDGK